MTCWRQTTYQLIWTYPWCLKHINSFDLSELTLRNTYTMDSPTCATSSAPLLTYRTCECTCWSQGSTMFIRKNRRCWTQFIKKSWLKAKTDGSTRITYTGLRGELEHLKIETRLIGESFVWWLIDACILSILVFKFSCFCIRRVFGRFCFSFLCFSVSFPKARGSRLLTFCPYLVHNVSA